MSAAERRLFDSLGTDFTTADVKKNAAAFDMQWKTAERYLGNFISRYRVAIRIKNGKYQKL